MSHIIAFRFQKGFLTQDTSAISGQVPIRSDHPVARHDDTDRIMADCAAKLKNRFFQNMTRHPDIEWEFVEARLSEDKEALEVLRLMEESGGEPDTIGIDETSGKLIFCDCSSESPAGRRSLCYDDEALQKRKKNPPKGSAVHQAKEMGVSLLTEELAYGGTQWPLLRP